MKRVICFVAVLCMTICLLGINSFAKEKSPGGIISYSDSDIFLEVKFVGMDGGFCIVDVKYKYKEGGCQSKREKFYAHGFEHYVELTPQHKLTLYHAESNGGELYALLNGKQI